MVLERMWRVQVRGELSLGCRKRAGRARSSAEGRIWSSGPSVPHPTPQVDRVSFGVAASLESSRPAPSNLLLFSHGFSLCAKSPPASSLGKCTVFHLGPSGTTQDNVPISKSPTTSPETLPGKKGFTSSRDWDVVILSGPVFSPA